MFYFSKIVLNFNIARGRYSCIAWEDKLSTNWATSGMAICLQFRAIESYWNNVIKKCWMEFSVNLIIFMHIPLGRSGSGPIIHISSFPSVYNLSNQLFASLFNQNWLFLREFINFQTSLQFPYYIYMNRLLFFSWASLMDRVWLLNGKSESTQRFIGEFQQVNVMRYYQNEDQLMLSIASDCHVRVTMDLMYTIRCPRKMCIQLEELGHLGNHQMDSWQDLPDTAWRVACRNRNHVIINSRRILHIRVIVQDDMCVGIHIA